ncbi:MAG: hypothetical protein ACE366_01655 [Bradymonadia bacterium]
MTLTQVRQELSTQLDNPVFMSSVVIRVLLGTGVNLKEIKPEQDRDAAAVSKVRSFIGTLGYSV